MKTKWIIVIAIFLAIILGAFIIIKLNHPAAIGVRKFFTLIGSLTVVDSNKIREYDKQAANYQEEIDRLQKGLVIVREQRTRDSLELINEKHKANQIEGRYKSKIVALESKLEEFRKLEPNNVLQYLDYLSGKGLESVLYIIGNDTLGIVDINRIKFAVEKILQANSYAEQILELEEWVANLEVQVSKLESINNGLLTEVNDLNRAMSITVEQRDVYRNLYLESHGKVRKSSIVAYGVGGIAVLLFILTL
jgi:hypothetical protein